MKFQQSYNDQHANSVCCEDVSYQPFLPKLNDIVFLEPSNVIDVIETNGTNLNNFFCIFDYYQEPSFLNVTPNSFEIVSVDYSLFVCGIYLSESKDETIYNSSGNIDLFAGYNYNKHKYGIEIGGSVGRIAYEGKFGSISVDFLTAKAYISYTDGKLKPDIGFGWIDFGVSINIKTIFGY